MLYKIVSIKDSISTEVRMTFEDAITAAFTVLKAHELPIDSSVPLATQLQVVTCSAQRTDTLTKEDMSQSYLNGLQQLTKHYYAPLAKSVCLTPVSRFCLSLNWYRININLIFLGSRCSPNRRRREYCLTSKAHTRS